MQVLPELVSGQASLHAGRFRTACLMWRFVYREISQKLEEVRAIEGPNAKWKCVRAVQNEIEEICGQRISPQRLVEVAKMKGCQAIAFTYK